MKLQLLEVALEHQVQHQDAEHLLSGQPVAAKVQASPCRDQIGKDLLVHRRKAVENLGHASQKLSMFVGDLGQRQRRMDALNRALGGPLPHPVCATGRKSTGSTEESLRLVGHAH